MKLVLRFFSNEVSSSIILIMATVCAMLMANFGATQGMYRAFLSLPIELRIGALNISKTMLTWINDALMAAFFLLVGLEIKHELVEGSLAGRQFAVLPAVGALGGMVVPALIYLGFNYQDPVARTGWAIPVATDIAFALGILSLLGNTVPIALRVFLMALAIIDDLGSIVIVALFYTNKVSILLLSIASILIIGLASLNLFEVRRSSAYIVVGAILWIALLKSGVHPTLAGVIVGLFIPIKGQNKESPVRQLVLILRPWVAFIILPLFAFANAGISFQELRSLSGFSLMLPLGIIAGLFIGKPLGVSLFCWLALHLKLARLADGVVFEQIMATGILCGIGFTMAIFIANLAFSTLNPDLVVLSKLSVLIASLLAAFVGSILLKMFLQKDAESS